MTARLDTTFVRLRESGRGAFVPFLMLGDPDPETSLQLIAGLLEGGADMLELGLAFSDPPGDGPVVQGAAQRALAAGMTTARALTMIRDLRATTDVPISLLCYYNVVLQYGVDAFYRDVAKAGADAVLVADLSLEESAPAVEGARHYEIAPVFMVSELTTDDRMAQIATVAGGYVYAVAHVGVTGEQGALAPTLPSLVERCRRHIPLPILAGFGISSPSQARDALRAGADGVICGSAIVKRATQAVARPDSGAATFRAFIAEMKAATVAAR